MTDDVTRDVTPPAIESQAEDPDAPWRFAFRGRKRDRAILERVIEAHRSMGLDLSLNDALLVLIRRGATPDADTQEEARGQIEQHCAECAHGCTMTTMPPRCPEGWRLYDAYHRVRDRTPATPSPAPPPRRTLLGIGRKAS